MEMKMKMMITLKFILMDKGKMMISKVKMKKELETAMLNQ